MIPFGRRILPDTDLLANALVPIEVTPTGIVIVPEQLGEVELEVRILFTIVNVPALPHGMV